MAEGDHVVVADLDAAIEDHERRGWHLVRIRPADAPSLADLERDGETVRLVTEHAAAARVGRIDHVVVTRRDGDEGGVGRAGMRYRDLLEDRAGGAVIASRIAVPDGGPVPDRVHHHSIDFQVIVCVAGWVDVVYEDQGPPFRMVPGDGVLQPPGIAHRVLRASPGLEVVEVCSPAVHDTHIDRDLELPTTELRPDRDFGGQRFLRWIAARLEPEPWSHGLTRAATGVAAASRGAGDVVVVRGAAGSGPGAVIGTDRCSVLHVIAGSVELSPDADSTTSILGPGDSAVAPFGAGCRLRAGGVDTVAVLIEVAPAPSRGQEQGSGGR